MSYFGARVGNSVFEGMGISPSVVYCRRVESVDYAEIAASLITAKAANCRHGGPLADSRGIPASANRLVIRPRQLAVGSSAHSATLLRRPQRGRRHCDS